MTALNGMVKNNTNKFAATYRLIDILVVHFALYVSVTAYNHPYTTDYFILSLIGSLGFALIAESFSMYRSWRAAFFKQVAFYTLTCRASIRVFVLGYLFFNKQVQEYSHLIRVNWNYKLPTREYR